ncbi:hypothetical protein FGADI_4342 [Fusarium gaditjirri]|uniref:AB hydrolase-1 domain-containing protein n=1 Tax=Fusarium gaditjirri TaxID=282569 RepID=A0A8H4TD33_9HYPO|nr:hypothetical protein FGADI_4342 [Fusarium gaditjirri]
MTSKTQSQHVQIRPHVKLHCVVQGPVEGPVILFSNSLSTNLHAWDSFVERLSSQPRFSQYCIVRYDHRGHGESPVETDEPCNFDLLAEDVALLLDHLRIARLNTFVGVSMGAATAAYFAARYPERVERTVIADVLTHGPLNSSSDPFEQRIVLANTDNGRPLMEETLPRWFPDPQFLEKRPDVRLSIGNQILSTPVRGFVNAVRALQKFDLRPLLPKLKGGQVLIIVGELDGPLPTTMRLLSDAVPGSKYVLIKGAGHLSFIDGEDQFLRAVSDFMKQESA